ncbi:putative 2-dehydropantoate 2-reductase [soil metagenome]
MTGQKIAIVGSGSVGLFYGGKLAAAGHDVTFLARSGFEEARREGIRIHSDAGDIHLASPKVARTAEEIGPVDLAIISLKATANDVLPQLIAPLLGKETSLLTLQNGLGSDELLAAHFGAERVLGALCFVCLTRRTPASVNHIGHGLISIGEYQRPPLPRTHEFVEAFQAAGVNAKIAVNLGEERWRKLGWNVPFNGLAVAENGATVDQILAKPELLAECRALMGELITAANKLGYPIEREYAERHIENSYSMGAYRPSTLVDWEEGRELEIEPIWGEPLRRATAVGVKMPHLEKLYRRLKSCRPHGQGGTS